MALSVIGLILAIVALIFGTMKRVGIVPMTIVSALIVIFTSGINLWEGIGVTYASGFASGYTNFFLIFAASCIYSKVMELSGSAVKIANKILEWVGEKNVMTACCITGGVLCYGGVNGAVLAFILVPIMSKLFYKANIHRRYMMTVIMVANTLWCNWLPGSTQMSNVLPAKYLGTSLTAAPVMGIVASAIVIVLQLIYVNYAVRKSQAKGESFTFPPNIDVNSYTNEDEDLPSAIVAFLPFIVMVGLAVFGGSFITNATALTTTAILSGAAVCFVLNFKKLMAQDPKTFLATAIANGILSVGNIAAVSAMASVFKLAPAYQATIDLVVNADANIYIKAAAVAAVAGGMAGSSMTGLTIVFSSLTDFFLASGANMAVLHRLLDITSLPLSALPNCAGHYVQLGVIGLTQGDCYKDTFIVNVVIGGIVAIGCVAVAVLFF